MTTDSINVALIKDVTPSHAPRKLSEIIVLKFVFQSQIFQPRAEVNFKSNKFIRIPDFYFFLSLFSPLPRGELQTSLECDHEDVNLPVWFNVPPPRT